MRSLVLCALLALPACRLGAAMQLQPVSRESAPAAPAPFARVEEELVTLRDGGNILFVRAVGRGGPEKEEALSAGREHILAKLGVKSVEELDPLGLEDKYDEERRKWLEVKEMDERRLAFYDAEGKLKKQLFIGHSVNTVQNRTPGGGSTLVMTSRDCAGIVSKDRRYALYVEFRSEFGAAVVTTGKLEYYEAPGRLLWKTVYPRGRIASGLVSDDGSRVFVTEKWSGRPAPYPDEMPDDQFAVYSRTGQKLFTYPRTAGSSDGIIMSGSVQASPDGRYAGVRAEKLGKPLWLFFDTAAAAYWVYDGRPAAGVEMFNGGQVLLERVGGEKPEPLELKDKKFRPVK